METQPQQPKYLDPVTIKSGLTALYAQEREFDKKLREKIWAIRSQCRHEYDEHSVCSVCGYDDAKYGFYNE